MKRYFLLSSIVAITIISCSKEEGQGGRSSISGTIEGTDINKARTEVTEIVCYQEAGGINQQNYFLLGSPTGTNHVVWYDKTGASIAPSAFSGIRDYIEVDISSGDNAITVAEKTRLAINNIAGNYYTATRNNEVLIITCNQTGAAIDADNGTLSLFMVDVLTQGKDQVTNQSGAFANEDVFIIYGDEDDIHDDEIKTNYDGTFKFTNLREGSYKIFAYSKDESNVNEPLTPVFETIQIGGDEDASVGTITIEKIND